MGIFRELFYKSRKSQTELAKKLNYSDAKISFLKRRKINYFSQLEHSMRTLSVNEVEAEENGLIITVKLK